MTSPCSLCRLLELVNDGQSREAIAAALVIGVGLEKSGATISVCPRCRLEVERFAAATGGTVAIVGARAAS